MTGFLVMPSRTYHNFNFGLLRGQFLGKSLRQGSEGKLGGDVHGAGIRANLVAENTANDITEQKD